MGLLGAINLHLQFPHSFVTRSECGGAYICSGSSKEGQSRRTAIIAVMLRRAVLSLFPLALVLSVAITACTPAPEGANYWQQVQREWESCDYPDTLNYLNDVLRNENTFNARASALKVTIFGGMARAALEIEEACATGIYLVAQWETKPYKNCIDQFRFQARSRTLGLMDALVEFDKATAGADTLSLDFSLPRASAGASSMVGRTGVGAMPVEKAFEAAIPRVVDRQLVLQVQDSVGAGEFKATLGMFESPPVTVSKAQFLVGVAKTLLVAATVFDKDRLDDEPKRTVVLKRARADLKPALDGDDARAKPAAKVVAKQIQTALQG